MIEFLMPVMAYAEVHYRWRFFPSRIYMPYPEIIADVPFRLEPDTALPVLCIIKDAHRFPVRLEKIEVAISMTGGNSHAQQFDFENVLIEERFWNRTLSLSLPANTAGVGSVTVKFSLSNEADGKFEVVNDNFKTLPPLNLSVLIPEFALPSLPGWSYGDFHTHSEFTDDKVEFGAPIMSSSIISKSIGLDFFVVADHSYNLDNSIEFPYENDADLPRWHKSREEMREAGTEEGALPVPAEEVSCGNRKGENVHLLVVDPPVFIPGNGDCEDDYPDTEPTLSVAEVLDLMGNGAIAIAAHTLEKPPFGQRLLFNRGYWAKEDLLDDRIIGLQILNGLPDDSFRRGYEVWIDLILEGKRKIILAGNDAHGNFNHFRQIKIPFLSMHEHRKQLFGQVRTALKLDGGVELNAVLQALKKGRAQITTGPISDISLKTQNGKLYEIGDEYPYGEGKLSIVAASTKEFGKLKRIVIIKGEISARKEDEIHKYTDFADGYRFEDVLTISRLSRGYVRIEVYTESNDKESFSITNPIWLTGGA